MPRIPSENEPPKQKPTIKDYLIAWAEEEIEREKRWRPYKQAFNILVITIIKTAFWLFVVYMLITRWGT